MDSNGTVLIVDDEAAMRDACRQALQREGMTVHEADSAPAALEVLSGTDCEIVLLDLKMPGMDGIEVLKRIRADHVTTSVIVITGYPSVDSAVEAMKWGAVDYLAKPFDANTLRVAVGRALARRSLPDSHSSSPRCRASTSEETLLIGETTQIRAVRDLVERVAETDSTVLIMGESGTGKEVVARMVHAHSRRAGSPFVIVDCTMLVDALVENELFGHVRGSYTGATTTTHGRVELADGGTLFLDEVGCLSVGLQSKLLRAIERGEFMRVGSNETLSVDTRVVAAANTDLMRAVQRGEFREDLYYRLSVVPIVLPPLRQRKLDIPLLAQHFLRLHCAARRTSVTRISPEAMKVLMAHQWPGNVRELSNAIERAVVLAGGTRIEPDDLLHYGFAYRMREEAALLEHLTLEELERRHIMRVLRTTDGNKQQTAEVLGIDRKTLRRKLRRYEAGSK